MYNFFNFFFFLRRTDGPRVPSRQVSVSSPRYRGWWERGSESLGAEQRRPAPRVRGVLQGWRPGATVRGEPPLVALARPWHSLCLFVCRLLPRAVALGGRCGPDLPQPFRGSSWRDAPGLWNGLRSHPHPHQAATGWSGRTSPGTWSCSCHRGDACPGGPQGSRVSLRGWNEEQSLPRGAQGNGRVQASKYTLRLPSLQPSRFPSHLFMFWKC